METNLQKPTRLRTFQKETTKLNKSQNQQTEQSNAISKTELPQLKPCSLEWRLAACLQFMIGCCLVSVCDNSDLKFRSPKHIHCLYADHKFRSQTNVSSSCQCQDVHIHLLKTQLFIQGVTTRH